MELWERTHDGNEGLFVQQCGHQHCESGHQYGPGIRPYFLIHFVASGRGVFCSEGKEYALSEGQGFIIFPGQVISYWADAKNPWVYGWVGYAGHQAEMLTAQAGLTRENPVFAHPESQTLFALLEEMAASAAQMRLGTLMALGGLYRFLAIIGENLPHTAPDAHQIYYQKAVWYMEGNYERALQIADVAAFVGLSRSQLFRVFQEVAGQSPKTCLQDIRMRRARALLETTALSLEQVAASAGLGTAARLGVLFREANGVTPGQYRRGLRL